jgi:hypothetical protein
MLLFFWRPDAHERLIKQQVVRNLQDSSDYKGQVDQCPMAKQEANEHRR